MKNIDLPPIAPTLIESTRAIGYTLEAAVADIIDNSIAAAATNVSISFFPLDGAYISILDNGRGMNGEQLTAAMQYGSQNPLNERSAGDLGRFGLGLKTASLSQCRTLTVASKCEGQIEVRRWDIDTVIKTGSWTLLAFTEPSEINALPDIDKLKALETGTLVIWQNLDRMQAGCIDFTASMGRKIDSVRDHLSLVYHRYLTGEPGIQKLSITINGIAVEPTDPFLVKKSDQSMQEEVYVVHGAKIRVQPYILPHVSKLSASELKQLGGKDGLRKKQGFYVYRNKRLIVWGTWFRMMRKGELSKLARIRVDIPNTLDDLWTLDIKKSTAIPPEEVRNNLANVIDHIGSQSKVKFTRRGRIETSDNDVHLWNRMKGNDGGFYYEINRSHPLVKRVSDRLGKDAKLLDSVLGQIEKSLPLNQLYIDLTGDERIVNDAKQNEKEIYNVLKSLLTDDLTYDQKLELINSMAYIKPYKDYPKVIERLKKEVSCNGKQ